MPASDDGIPFQSPKGVPDILIRRDYEAFFFPRWLVGEKRAGFWEIRGINSAGLE